MKRALTNADRTYGPEFGASNIAIGLNLSRKYAYLPTWRRIMADFEVSRATAYRWRKLMEDNGWKPIGEKS